MEYDERGHVKAQDKTYPLRLYKKGGDIVVVNSDEERDAALAAGASTKVWDKEKHQ